LKIESIESNLPSRMIVNCHRRLFLRIKCDAALKHLIFNLNTLKLYFKLKFVIKMKRTTERSDLQAKQVPEFISGCRQFEGEDLSKWYYLNYMFKETVVVFSPTWANCIRLSKPLMEIENTICSMSNKSSKTVRENEVKLITYKLVNT